MPARNVVNANVVTSYFAPTHVTGITNCAAPSCRAASIRQPGPLAGRIDHLVGKAKSTPEEALRYAERRLSFSKLRTNEARQRLVAVSHPSWLRVVADMGLQPMALHKPVNRDRTGYEGWGL
jgi:hypothetical protein